MACPARGDRRRRTAGTQPKNLDMRQTAGIPLMFLTAWEGQVDAAKMQAKQRVRAQGGAGGESARLRA
ncbi:hypothetical protein D9M68_68970 [compost metagenome]